MRRAILFCLLSAGCSAASAPIEVWLTPERRDTLKKVAARPYITKQERLDDDTVVYHWANRKDNAVTTQKVTRILGAKSSNGWQKKLDAKDAEKKALLDDLAKIKDKPTKKDLEKVIGKHSAKGKVQ